FGLIDVCPPPLGASLISPSSPLVLTLLTEPLFHRHHYQQDEKPHEYVTAFITEGKVATDHHSILERTSDVFPLVNWTIKLIYGLNWLYDSPEDEAEKNGVRPWDMLGDDIRQAINANNS
ncbi:hypothetical protein M8C21_028449, partial [Ambrosia artemisiifolia]